MRRREPSNFDRRRWVPTVHDAFISYSHAADGRLAPAVQRGLERLARPWNKRRALSLFRDEKGLSAGPAAWTSIEQALDGSRYFVLLASPEAARSERVAREIATWLERSSADTILAVLSSGDWIWDEDADDFDWEASTAVPPALRGAFSQEPRHLDLRWARTAEELDLRNSRFRDAIAELAAPMHGIAKDQLENEDIRQDRKLRRARHSAIVALVVLALGASTAGLLALLNARGADRQRESAELSAAEADRRRASAEEQRALADEQRALAVIREAEADAARLAGLAESLAPISTDVAALIALESLARAPSQQGWTSLQEALSTETPAVAPRPAHEGPVLDVAVRPDGSGYVTAGLDGLRWWQLGADEPIAVSATPGVPQRLVFNGDGTLLAVAESIPSSSGGTVRLFDALSMTEVGAFAGSEGVVRDVAFAAEGSRLASVADDGLLRIWDVVTGAEVASVIVSEGDSLWSIAASREVPLIAVGSGQGPISVYQILDDTLGLVSSFTGHDGPVLDMEFLGTFLLTGGADSTVRLWDSVAASEITPSRSGHTGPVHTVEWLATDPPTVASGDAAGDVRIWDLTLPQLDRPIIQAGAAIQGISGDPAGRFLVGAASDGTVRVWNLDARGFLVTRFGDDVEAPFQVAIDPQARFVAVSTFSGNLMLWDVATGSTIGDPLRINTNLVLDMRLDEAATTLVVASWEGVYLVDVATWSITAGPLTQHAGVVWGVDADGAGFVTVGEDGRVIRWGWAGAVVATSEPIAGAVSVALDAARGSVIVGTASGTLVRLPSDLTTSDEFGDGMEDEVLTVAVSPDGTLVAAGTQGGEVGLFDVSSGELVTELPRQTDRVWSLAFIPDRRLLITTSTSGEAILWDVPSGERFGAPLIHGDQVFDIAIAGQAGRLATTSADRRIHIWTSVSRWPALACDATGRNLSLTEWEHHIGQDVPYRRTCPDFPSGEGAPAEAPPTDYSGISGG